MGKIRALVLTVVSLLAAGLLLTPHASAAYSIDAEDIVAKRSRTYTAWNNDHGTVFEVSFRTVLPNEKRRVRARIELSVPSTQSDPMVVARHAIRCGRAGETTYEQLYGVRNILRGESFVQSPRYTFTAGMPGEYRCWLWLGTGRPRPSETRHTTNYFKLGWGSSLQVTRRIHPASDQHLTPLEPSHVLMPGEASDENVLTWRAPLFTRSFAANGDAYLTTCTSIGGSMDPVLKKHLCEGLTKIYGSRVNTRLIVGQLRADGTGYCALHYFPSKAGRQTYITRDIHHVVVYNSGTVPVRTDNGCGRTFRLKVLVKAVDGGAVLVHRQGTLTAVLPPG